MNQCFSPDEIQEICDEIPAGRMGNPEEVGEMAFLLAQAPIYLTGQIITLDGRMDLIISRWFHRPVHTARHKAPVPVPV